ncbi:hypothetical protein E4U21_004748 [Claviceps maximensis]|nr:hypothetical protein E4U21_004748 [Claviceps maximensis]
MTTKQERLADRLKHLQELQKTYPDVDIKDMAAAMQQNIDFEFDVKEALGEDTWIQMNNVFHHKFSDQSAPDPQTGLAEARRYLQGHEDLENRFDAIYRDASSVSPDEFHRDASSVSPDELHRDVVSGTVVPDAIHEDTVFHAMVPDALHEGAVFDAMTPESRDKDTAFDTTAPESRDKDTVFDTTAPEGIHEDAVFNALTPESTTITKDTIYVAMPSYARDEDAGCDEED